MVMTVGGDGTLLAASHHLGKDDKIMGFKSSRSSVGYLCLGDRTMIPEVVKRLFSNTLAYVSVARLCAKVTRAGAADAIVSEPVLNDILFVNANPASTTRYMIHHGNDCEEHRSSGIWFSTAIGSSAGIRAAGGERVPSTARLFQYRVRELYRPTGSRLHLAGGFFEENSGLRVQNFNESGLLALDGQHGAIELSYGDEFVVTSAPPIQIASLPEAAPSKSLGFLGANFAST
jgi:NAD+ kinase